MLQCAWKNVYIVDEKNANLLNFSIFSSFHLGHDSSFFFLSFSLFLSFTLSISLFLFLFLIHLTYDSWKITATENIWGKITPASVVEIQFQTNSNQFLQCKKCACIVHFFIVYYYRPFFSSSVFSNHEILWIFTQPTLLPNLERLWTTHSKNWNIYLKFCVFHFGVCVAEEIPVGEPVLYNTCWLLWL